MTPMNKALKLRLFEPIQATLQIVRVYEKVVASNTAEVIVGRLSPYSLSFFSGLRFPVSRHIRIRLSRTAAAGGLQVEGWISSSSHIGSRYMYTLELDEASGTIFEYQRLYNGLYRRQHLLMGKVTGLYASQELVTI